MYLFQISSSSFPFFFRRLILFSFSWCPVAVDGEGSNLSDVFEGGVGRLSVDLQTFVSFSLAEMGRDTNLVCFELSA